MMEDTVKNEFFAGNLCLRPNSRAEQEWRITMSKSEKVYAMSFAKIYPMLTAKAEKKGRSREEVEQIICWLTGYTAEEIEDAIKNSTTYGDFFRNAPKLNPNRKLIKGVICGVRVEDIEEPLMQEIRYLDKLVDELEYKTSKGAMQFPYDKPLPLTLITEIAEWCGRGQA